MSRARPVLLLALLAPLCLLFCLLWGPSGIVLPHTATGVGRAIFLLRLHRIAAGFVVGAALSCSGVIFQALLRNPLAEPYVLGVSSGAGLGAAAAILSGLAAANAFFVPFAAFAMAAATLGAVYALARRDGPPSLYGLILSGVIVSSICSSLLMFLVSVAPVEGLHSVLWWMLGHLEVGSRPLLYSAAGVVGIGTLAAWGLAREFNALTLGREMAHHVGVRTRAALLAGLALGTLLAAAAVGLAGIIGFVGLIVPHAMRGVAGADHRRLIPAAALGGGAFLALCDTLARTVLAPQEIPVGVVTALAGGPFFLFLLRRRHRQGWIE